MICKSKNIVIESKYNNLKDILTINITGKLKLSFNINISKVMHPWLIAYTPYMQKSKDSNIVVIANTIAYNREQGIFQNYLKPAKTWLANESNISKIMDNLEIPEYGLPEIEKYNSIHSINKLIEEIPYANDISKWRFIPSIDAIVKKYIYFEINNNPNIKRLERSIIFKVKNFYSSNVEYAITSFKKLLIANKVKLPFTAPKLLFASLGD